MDAILIGAGAVAREVMRRVGKLWSLTVIDPSEELLTETKGVRPFTPVVGDGSSKVTLERAGYADADALIAASNDDDVNLEACRLALEEGVFRVLAVAVRSERLPEYRELGVTAFAPAELAARRVELAMEARRIDSKAFAQGRAEAVEVRVAPDSIVRDKALRELGRPSWIVGSILRDGSLIDPTGETRLQADDLVTVVGPATDFTHIVRTFTSGEPRFPLDFGKRVAVALEGVSDLGSTFGEAVNLVRVTTATSVLVVHPENEEGEGSRELKALLEGAEYATEGISVRYRPVRGRAADALVGLVEEESVGVLVVPPPGGPGPIAAYRTGRVVERARSLGVPILLSRGKIDYERVLIPARDTQAGRAAARAAIDIAGLAKAKISALAVAQPSFLAGPSAAEDAAAAIAWLKEEAAVQGVEIQAEVKRGNPVRAFIEAAADADLIVVGAGTSNGLLSERVTRHLIRNTRASVLVVPVQG